jgi:hypothetical protein
VDVVESNIVAKYKGTTNKAASIVSPRSEIMRRKYGLPRRRIRIETGLAGVCNSEKLQISKK